MKRIYSVIIIALLTMQCYGQSWEWAKKSNQCNDCWALKILPCSNTGFYLTGIFTDVITFDNITLKRFGKAYFLARFDVNGNCLWLKETIQYRDACTDVMGNFYISGFFSGQVIVENYTLSTTHTNAGIIAKYSPSGNLLDIEKVDGDNVWCRMKTNSLNQLIVATGFTDSLNYKGNVFTDSTGLLLKLDTGLNVIQSKATSIFSSAIQLELDANDTIYMVSHKRYPCMYCKDAKFLKYSPDLALLVDHFYTNGVGSHYYEDPVITSHTDGNIYVMQPLTYSDGYAFKFSSTFDKIWGKELKWRGSFLSKNNKLFLFGRTAQMNCLDTIRQSSIIIEMDTSLSCLKYKALPFDNILTGPGPFFNHAFVDASNNIYVSGFTDKQTVFDSIIITPSPMCRFIAKLNYSGTTTEITKYGEDRKLLVFPNPSSNIININYSNKNAKEKLQLFIMNMMGENVYSKDFKVENGKIQESINITALAKGFYFLEIRSGNERQIQKIIVD